MPAPLSPVNGSKYGSFFAHMVIALRVVMSASPTAVRTGFGFPAPFLCGGQGFYQIGEEAANLSM